MFDIYANDRLDGRYDVAQTARLVARFHYVEAQLMRILAGKLASIPVWEAKCLLGRHLWQDSLHAQSFLTRLVDLRWPRKAPLHPGTALAGAIAIIDDAPSTLGLLNAVYRVVKPRLIAAYTAHLQSAAPLADEPTCYILRQTLAEESVQLQEGNALIESFGNDDDLAMQAWQERFDAAWAAIPPLGVPSDEVGREIDNHFEGQTIHPAPPIATRDARFQFGEDGFAGMEVAADQRVRFMAHRDADNEMHAAEVLGRNLYEHPEMPWEYHADTARQCWDEVRHAVLYQKYLESLGGRLGEFPVVPGNYAYRMGLSFPHRLYDLHLRGEKLGMPDLIRMRQEALRRGDTRYAMLNDYVHADEVPHVKNGRWLTWLLKDDRDAFRQIERETMELRAAYEASHPNDPLLQAYTGLPRGRRDED